MAKEDKELQNLIKKHGKDFVDFLKFTYLSFPSSKIAMAFPEYLVEHKQIMENFEKEMEERPFREVLGEYLKKLEKLENKYKDMLLKLKRGQLLKKIKELV